MSGCGGSEVGGGRGVVEGVSEGGRGAEGGGGLGLSGRYKGLCGDGGKGRERDVCGRWTSYLEIHAHAFFSLSLSSSMLVDIRK